MLIRPLNMNERDRRLAQRELERRNRLISAGKSTLSAVPPVPDSRADANGERRREMEEYQLKLNDQRARFAVHQDQQQQLQNGQHHTNMAAEMESQERAAMVQAALDRYHKERSLRDAIYEEKRKNFKQRRSGSQASNNESQGTGEVPPLHVQEQPHRLMQAVGGMQWPAALSESGDGDAYGQGSHQTRTPMTAVPLPGMDAGDLREQRDARQLNYGQQLRDQMLERVRRSQEEQMAAFRESKAAQGGESEGQAARPGLLSKDTYRAALQQQIEDQRAYSRHDPAMGEVGEWQDGGYTRDPQGLNKQQYREALQQQLAEQHHQPGHRPGRGPDDGVFELDEGGGQGQAPSQALRKEQYRHALQQQMAEQHRAGQRPGLEVQGPMDLHLAEGGTGTHPSRLSKEQYRDALQRQMNQQRYSQQPPDSEDHEQASSLPGLGGPQQGRDNPHTLSKEQYRDALERQIAEQQRHKRPQPMGAYQEDPDDGYLSGASLPGHRAEDQRHRSRLSKEEYRDVLEQQIAEQRHQSRPMQSLGQGTGGLLPGPPSTTTRTHTQHPHAQRLSKDEYRDLLEQQIAEKRHQPRSGGGLGTTRRNKRTLPGGRGDTDQPHRLTKEEYRDALEQQIAERQQPRPRTVVRQGRDGEGTLGLLPGGAVPINPRGDRDHPHKLSKEEYREALEQQIAEQHHHKAVPERDTWPSEGANAFPPRRVGEHYPRQDRGQDGHRSTFEPARRAGDNGSYGGYGDDQAGRQGPSGRDLGPAAGMAGGYGGYGDEHMGRHGPAGGGGGGTGRARQSGGYGGATEPPSRRSLGPPAGGWYGEDPSLGGSGYAPAPLESPTLPGSFANSSAGRKGAGLSKEEYRAELERQMSEHRQRKVAEKERDRAEAAAVTLSLPSGRHLGRPSPPRHFGRPAVPPPAPQPSGYRPSYTEHAPEDQGYEHGAWAQQQAHMGQVGPAGHMNQLGPMDHMGGYSSRRSRDDDHQGPTGLGLPSQRQAVRQSMPPPPAEVYNPMPLGPAAGYYGQGVEEDRVREEKWRKAAYASELKQQMEEAKARKKRDKMESLMPPDPFPLGALGGSPSPPPRRGAVPLLPVPPPGPHRFSLMAPPAMPGPSASTPRLAVLEPPPHYTEQQQVPWHMQGAQQAYPSPEGGMSGGFLPGQGHVWGSSSDARGPAHGHPADPASGFHPSPSHRRGHSYPVDEPTGLMLGPGGGPGGHQASGGVPYMHNRGAASPNWETEGAAFPWADGRKGRGQALREIQGLDDPHEAEKRMKQAAHAQMLTMQVEDNARRKAAEKAALADQERRETERVERERQQMEVLYKAEQEKKRQEEEMKQMLQKQIEDKKRQQQEDKHRQLEEERKDLERVQREQEQLQRKYEAEQKGRKPGWGSEDGGSALSRGHGGNRSPVFGREGDGRSSVASNEHRPLDSMASGLRSKQNDGSPLKSGKAKHTEEPGGFYTGQDTGNSPFRSLEGEMRKYRAALEGLKEETGKAREEALRARAEQKHVQGEMQRLKARISDGEAGAGVLRGVCDLPKILDDPLDLLHMWMVPGPDAEATERNGRPESLDYLPRAANEMEKVLKCDDMNANFKGLSLNVDDQSPFSTGCRDTDNKLYGLHNLGFAETLRPAKFAWTGAEAEAGRSPQRAYISPTKITSNQYDEQTGVLESLKADTHFVFPDGRRFTGGCGKGLPADPFVSAEPDAISVGRGAEQLEVETGAAGAGAAACECVETVVCCQGAYCGDGACCCNTAVETTASAVDMFDVDVVLERAKDRCCRLELLGREGEMGDDVYKFLRRSRKYVDGYLPLSDAEEGECAQGGSIDRKRPDDDVDLYGSVRWVTRGMGAIGMPRV